MAVLKGAHKAPGAVDQTGALKSGLAVKAEDRAQTDDCRDSGRSEPLRRMVELGAPARDGSFRRSRYGVKVRLAPSACAST